MDLNKLRLKTASQLNDAERTFIREHSADLTDEDKSAYADFLTPSENAGEPENGGEAGAAGEGNVGTGEGEGASGGGETPTPAPTPPTEPSYQFKTEEEAKAFVQKTLAEEKQKAIDAATTPEEKKYVEENWKPKNWNEAFKTAAEAAADLVEQRQQAQAKKIEEHNKKVEAEWQALRTEHKLEDVTTEAGLKIHNAIVDIGVKFGRKNFKDAYEAYMMIPKEKGGGYEVPVSDAAAVLAKQKADKLAEQKKVAAKVGGQNPGAGSVKGNAPLKPISYEDMKTKSKSKLIKEALAS
jgi:hypothetical protein